MQTLDEFLADDDTSRYGSDTYKARVLIKFWIDHGKSDEHLDLSDLNIHTLPPLPDAVQHIICCNEFIVYMGALPAHLKILILTHSSNVRRLPHLPECLEVLDIGGTLIQRLPNMPCGLKILDAAGSCLTHLWRLYTGIHHVNISRTHIRKFIGVLPDTLRVLNISGTNIGSLPNLPRRLEILDAVRTPLKTLPEFPFSLRIIHVNGCKELLLQRAELTDEFGNIMFESIYDYGLRWSDWHEEQRRRGRYTNRMNIFSEDLIAECWSPKRMELIGFEE